MQIEVTEIEPCRLSVVYTADAGEIFNKRGEVAAAFKKAPVPGFRPGKATMDAIKSHYRTQIEESLKRALAEDAFHNTLFEKKIKPHGPPRFNSVLLADGKFTCEFDLHTKPDFDLPEHVNLRIPKPHEFESETEVVEKLLQQLRIQFGEVAPFTETDFVQKGDNVIIDYETELEGVKQDHLCATGEMITVGNSNFTAFDDQLLGMTLGETREFDLAIPKEGGMPSVAGKTVHIRTTLNMGSKSTPCPLDDSLAAKMGKKDMNELREYARGTAMASVQNKFKAQVNESVAMQLVEATTVNVPNWMTLSEAQYLAQSAKMDWTVMTDEDRLQFMNMAERNVKLSLILDRIREEHPEAQLTDQEVFEIIKRNLAQTKMAVNMDEVIDKMNKSGYLQILFSRVRDEHTMDYITKTVQFIE
jgi:trigger factor